MREQELDPNSRGSRFPLAGTAAGKDTVCACPLTKTSVRAAGIKGHPLSRRYSARRYAANGIHYFLTTRARDVLALPDK